MWDLEAKRACARRTAKRMREKRKALGLCYQCGKPAVPAKSRCYSCGEIDAANARMAFHSESATERGRRNDLRSINHFKAKYQAFNAYGGCRCSCCGETEMIFLSIDHINDDGGKHREEIGGGTSTRLYRWLRRKGYPPGFRVLCYNCNFGRYHYGGVCPHRRVQREVAVS